MNEQVFTNLNKIYGCSVEQIAQLTGEAESTVKVALNSASPVERQEITAAESDDAKTALVKQEIAKQAAVAPLLAAIEFTMLDKIRETVENVEPDTLHAADTLASLAKTVKTLTSHYAAQATKEESGPNNGIQFVINNGPYIA